MQRTARFGVLMAVLIGLACSPGALSAQPGISYPIEPPGPFVREALAMPYATALLAEFAKTVEKSADPACLHSRALDAAKLAERGRDLFERWGTRGMETIIGNVDVKAHEAGLAR